MTWRRAATVAPGIGVSLLPKLICPLCWPAYAGLLSALGLSFLINARNLVSITVRLPWLPWLSAPVSAAVTVPL